jgi:hypothetical protein
VSGCFNHQGWEGVPSTKGPLSLLIFDEDFDNGEGRMWFRTYDPLNDDWYEDADSSGLLSPIDFKARRALLIQSEAPALSSWGLAIVGIAVGAAGVDVTERCFRPTTTIPTSLLRSSPTR